MTWEPCLDDPCCPPLTNGGGITVPELRPVRICKDRIAMRDRLKLQPAGVWQGRTNLLRAFIASNCSSY